MISPFKTFGNWSWSLLSVYRSCPYRARLKKIDKSPEPPPEPNDPRTRGIRVHDNAQKYVEGTGPLTPELAGVEGVLADIKDVRDSGTGIVTLEEPIYLDSNWRVTTKENRWLVFITDVHVVIPGQLNMTGDYKTGKKFGNELKHYQQMELYCIGEWSVNAAAGTVFDTYTADLIYVDQKDVVSHEFTPEQLERARARLDVEVGRMMADKVHTPRPNRVTCKYCPFSPRGTGACPVGV